MNRILTAFLLIALFTVPAMSQNTMNDSPGYLAWSLIQDYLETGPDLMITDGVLEAYRPLSVDRISYIFWTDQNEIIAAPDRWVPDVRVLARWGVTHYSHADPDWIDVPAIPVIISCHGNDLRYILELDGYIGFMDFETPVVVIEESSEAYCHAWVPASILEGEGPDGCLIEIPGWLVCEN